MLSLFIFAFALVNFISLLIFKGKSNVLSCGLGAYNGKVKPNELLLKVIGQYNEERGIHSCGIAVNNFIDVGVGSIARFRNFVKDFDFPKMTKTFNVILHTRKATVGAHTKENAHPFGFGCDTDDPEVPDEEVGYNFIGAHNGSLIDWRDLTKDIEIPEEVTVNMDSQALLYRLYHDKNYKVLSEYKGAAALIFYNSNNPDRLYAFKGAAGDDEERPLYYVQYVNSRGKVTGVYLSSMKEPFEFAGLKDIKEVPNNTILTFEGGEVINELKVKRGKELSTAYARNSTAVTTTPSTRTNARVSHSGARQIPISTFTGSAKAHQLLLTPNEYFVGSHIVGGKIYYRCGRYFRNGHLINGIWLLREDGEQLGWYMTQAVANKGLRDFRKKYNKNKKKDKLNASLYYFAKGIMCKDFEAMNDANAMLDENSTRLGDLSKCSIYPITFVASTNDNYRVSSYPAWDGKLTFSAKFKPEFSLYTFEYNNGYLVDVQPVDSRTPFFETFLKGMDLNKKTKASLDFKDIFSELLEPKKEKPVEKKTPTTSGQNSTDGMLQQSSELSAEEEKAAQERVDALINESWDKFTETTNSDWTDMDEIAIAQSLDQAEQLVQTYAEGMGLFEPDQVGYEISTKLLEAAYYIAKKVQEIGDDCGYVFTDTETDQLKLIIMSYEILEHVEGNKFKEDK